MKHTSGPWTVGTILEGAINNEIDKRIISLQKEIDTKDVYNIMALLMAMARYDAKFKKDMRKFLQFILKEDESEVKGG